MTTTANLDAPASATPLLLAANFHLGLEHVLQGHQVIFVPGQGVAAKALQQLQVLHVDFQGTAGQIVIVEGRAGALGQLQPHVLDLVAGGPGDVVTIATTNLRHLARFPRVDAQLWSAIV